VRSTTLVWAWLALACACSGSSPASTGLGGDAGNVSGGDGGTATGSDGSAAHDASGDGSSSTGDASSSDTGTPTTWVPVAIGFDDLATGTDVTTQYAAHATFSSDPGCACRASSDAGLAASPPNYIFTYYTCATGPTASVFVDFPRPVRKVSFKGIGVNDASKVATIHVVTASGTQSVDLVGKGDYAVPVVVDLSSYQDVTRLEIVGVNDAYGMGFDDFAFEFPQ
jgi:hypothetical protein